MDVPTGHKQHSAPTPAVGGVILGFVGFILWVGLLPWTIQGVHYTLFVRVVAFASIIAAAMIGFIDDRRHRPPLMRLVLGTSLAVVIWTVCFLTHARAQLVLFAFNWNGRLFMSDAGAYGLAMFGGVQAIGLHHGAYGAIRTAEVVLLFLIAVFDVARLCSARPRRGVSPRAQWSPLPPPSRQEAGLETGVAGLHAAHGCTALGLSIAL